jgi:hypothetical protein
MSNNFLKIGRLMTRVGDKSAPTPLILRGVFLIKMIIFSTLCNKPKLIPTKTYKFSPL